MSENRRAAKTTDGTGLNEIRTVFSPGAGIEKRLFWHRSNDSTPNDRNIQLLAKSLCKEANQSHFVSDPNTKVGDFLIGREEFTLQGPYVERVTNIDIKYGNYVWIVCKFPLVGQINGVGTAVPG